MERSGSAETAPAAFENHPYMTGIDDLNVDEAVEILLNPDMERVSAAPAVLPRAGDVYVYVLDGYVKSDITKIRSDGNTWYSRSGKVLRAKTSGLRVQKYYWTLQNNNHVGDHRFKRGEFRLVSVQEHSRVPAH